MMFTASLTL